jgi:hypothetical protein
MSRQPSLSGDRQGTAGVDKFRIAERVFFNFQSIFGSPTSGWKTQISPLRWRSGRDDKFATRRISYLPGKPGIALNLNCHLDQNAA